MNVFKNLAPEAPSTTRWSQESVTFMMLPLSSISSLALVFFEIEPTIIYIVGAAVTFLNLIMLYNFNDSKMVRELKLEYQKLNTKGGLNDTIEELS